MIAIAGTLALPDLSALRGVTSGATNEAAKRRSLITSRRSFNKTSKASPPAVAHVLPVDPPAQLVRCVDRQMSRIEAPCEREFRYDGKGWDERGLRFWVSH
jgi:hypothetical protein